MRPHPFHPVTWFLLAVLGIQAIAPGTGGWGLVCIGCDRTGIAIGFRLAGASSGWQDGCCEAPGGQPAPNRPADDDAIGEGLPSPCGCICFELQRDNGPFTLPTGGPDTPVPLSLTPDSFDAWTLGSLGDDVSQRGPPAIAPGDPDRTLLGQHTSLTI